MAKAVASDFKKKLDQKKAVYKFREVNLTFGDDKQFYGKIGNEKDVVHFFRSEINETIEIQENFLVLYLDRRNNIIGFYHHSIGTRSSTTVDIQLVCTVALQLIASAVIVCHNHPSGSIKPSENDIKLTNTLTNALKLIGVTLIDHLIVTKHDNYSFFANHLIEQPTSVSSLSGTNVTDIKHLRQDILGELKKVTEANSPSIHEMLLQKDTYMQLEAQIISRIVATSLQPSAIIPQLEQELQMIG